MNDRELLEKAARAIGREFEPGFTETFWNPLQCDKDAFRLMVELGIIVHCVRHEEGFTTAKYCDIYIQQMHVGMGSLAATRRAITRAAAALADND